MCAVCTATDAIPNAIGIFRNKSESNMHRTNNIKQSQKHAPDMAAIYFMQT